MRKIKHLLQNLSFKSSLNFETKKKILKRASYIWYIKQNFKNHPLNVDFPEFMYLTGRIINSEAMKKAEDAVNQVALKGEKYIHRCFMQFLKQI